MQDIRVERIRTLRGPNIWASFPVLEALLDLAEYEALPDARLQSIRLKLVEMLPGLTEQRCTQCSPGGLLAQIELSAHIAHLIQHVTLELQSLAGIEATFGRTEKASGPGLYHVIVEYRDSISARTCVQLAISLIQNVAQEQAPAFDLSTELSAVRELAQDNMLGPSTQAIVSAAIGRGIPWFRLNLGALVQLGHGRYSRRIRASATSLTPSISSILASDKDLTKTLLQRSGIPVPQGEVVADETDAWAAAQTLGGPVVVKPGSGNQGRGVSVNLTSEAHVKKAFALAREISRSVIVERYLEGGDYRLLVIGRKMVAAAIRRPAHVVGDGLHTIGELVQIVNADTNRGSGHGAALTRIKMDGVAELTLTKQCLNAESIPPPGLVVFLRDNSNLSTGGTATDVTDKVHPDNITLAVQAARTVGLDVAGVDFVCKDIGLPLTEQGGGIVEVNAAPGLRMHLYPSEGKSRPVGKAIVDMLFPRGRRARVPLIAVTGTNGKTTVTRMVGHIFSTSRKFVGMAVSDGIYFGGIRREKGDCSGPQSAAQVLQHPDVEVAVLETARGGIIRSGLGWDKSTVSVVLNVSTDHLGTNGIETIEQLARVKRVIVEAVLPDGYGVFNADDPLVAGMAGYCPGRVIFFGMSRAAILEHLSSGGRGVYVQHGTHEEVDRQIILAEGATETALLTIGDIPATYGGLVPFQVRNALAAVAACWGAGVPLDNIRRGLATFEASSDMAPGRFNMLNVGGAKVILDYGHNAHAHLAIQEAVRHMSAKRKIGVVTSPGNRRDNDVQEMAAVAARTFDAMIVYEGANLRGRESGEIPRLISDAAKQVRLELPVTTILKERDAIAYALQIAQPGDLLVIVVAKVDEAIAQVKRAAEARTRV